MNRDWTTEFITCLTQDLRAFATLCGEILVLTQAENRALSGLADYRPAEFNLQKQQWVQLLDSGIAKLRARRQSWLQLNPLTRAASSEVGVLFGEIQNLLTRVLLLDRENQQAMLRRGLMPAGHLPPAAAQQPHFVSGLYRKHLK